MKCFNCQRDGHMARQCLKPKRKRDATWFRDKVLLVKGQGNGKVLNEEELKFLADPRVVEGPVTQTVITHNAAYQADDLDEYDFDCDDFSTAKDTNSSTQQDAMILSVFEQLSHQVTNYNKVNKDNLIANESLSTELERYKERIKFLEERQNVDLNFGKRFVPQQELSDEQAFRLQTSHPNTYQSASSPVRIKAPRELPKNTFVNVHSSVAMNDLVNYVEMCNKCLELEVELIKKHYMFEKDEYNKLLKIFSKLEQHCISLELAMQLNK
uniref:CCHC-type domain-containing protein n=1 Tax=Tanacetum cinerariifolium TaxID=118510 RepID=A0A6L2KWC7_TANCI|nr:hypothetical protein [Tanacetum cinerariifolium]